MNEKKGITATVPVVSIIPATKRSMHSGTRFRQQKNIRVAAYCRVSTGDESQQTSYTKQKEYYEKLICSKQSWKFAGIYADEAISGTSRVHRMEFNRMIDDAMAGRLDYIVTKSISRFARNTVDTLNCVRQLQQKNPPVGIWFEKENIDTLQASGELFLTILSALAQEESRSISDNIRWTFQKNFQAEKPQINLNRMLGYDKGENGEWVINQEQARIVRYIFSEFLSGESARSIARKLNSTGMKTVNNKAWRADTIYGILRNEKFVGDLEMQKTITKNFLTHQSVANTGEAPRYYVKNHHQAIIDRHTWNKTQAMLLEWGCKSNELSLLLEVKCNMMSYPIPKKRGPVRSPFSNLSCGAEREGYECGGKMVRMTYTCTETMTLDNPEDGGEKIVRCKFAYPVWKCRHKLEKNSGSDCASQVYDECALEQSFMEMLYKLKKDVELRGEDSDIVRSFKGLYEEEDYNGFQGLASDPFYLDGGCLSETQLVDFGENRCESSDENSQVNGKEGSGKMREEKRGKTAEEQNFDFFISCLKKLPRKNSAGMTINVYGIAKELKEGDEDIKHRPDYLNFEKSVYMAFIQSGVIYGDEIEYLTNFGLIIKSTGNSRSMKSFLGFRRANEDGSLEVLDCLSKVNNKKTRVVKNKA